jgi:hypothetical protein
MAVFTERWRFLPNDGGFLDTARMGAADIPNYKKSEGGEL